MKTLLAFVVLSFTCFGQMPQRYNRVQLNVVPIVQCGGTCLDMLYVEVRASGPAAKDATAFSITLTGEKPDASACSVALTIKRTSDSWNTGIVANPDRCSVYERRVSLVGTLYEYRDATK